MHFSLSLASLSILTVGLAQGQVGSTVIADLRSNGAPTGITPTMFHSIHDISHDGRYVLFKTEADLGAKDKNAEADLYLHDRGSGDTILTTVGSNGEALGDVYDFALSGDGSVACFTSSAAGYVAGDTNGDNDVFVRDRAAGTTGLVSVSVQGVPGDNDSVHARISDDGRYVAFESWASDLVAGDTNGIRDVFHHDVVTKTTVRVNLDASGAEVQAASATSPGTASGSRSSPTPF